MKVQQLKARIDPNSRPQTKEKQRPASPKSTGELSFEEVLHRQNDLEFSVHALKRLQNRSITMDKQDIKRLEDAVLRAEKKGSRDSLVMDGDRAFVVNIPNRKVITAVDLMDLKDKVFTNIDSTVLTKREL